MESEILEFVMDRVADAFSLSPLYPEEWSLMRFINAFLLVCAVAFLLAPVWGVAAVWYAVPMGWTANYLISFAGYLSGKWSRRRVI